jgi:hypothetical protein
MWILSRSAEEFDSWAFLFGRLPEIEVGLQFIPDFGVGTEGGRKAQGHIGRDAGLAIEDARQSCTRDLEVLCGGGYVNVTEKLSKNFAWVGRIVHTHAVFS